MPGVWIWSGSSSPSATMGSSTSTTVQRAAVAMMGLKLRCAPRRRREEGGDPRAAGADTLRQRPLGRQLGDDPPLLLELLDGRAPRGACGGGEGGDDLAHAAFLDEARSAGAVRDEGQVLRPAELQRPRT